LFPFIVIFKKKVTASYGHIFALIQILLIFNLFLGDLLYQYFKKIQILANFSVKYVKDTCVIVEKKLYHRSTNVLKYFQHLHMYL
jgi:hypothetical protein